MMQFYDDGVVQLDRAALTLRRYHFPSGTAKVIPLDQIRGYQAESLGFLMARSISGAGQTFAAGCHWTCTGR